MIKKGEQSIVGLKKKNGTSFYCKKLIAISIRRNLDGVKNEMDIAYGAWEPLIAKGLQSYVKKKSNLIVVNVGQAFPSFLNVFIRRTAVGPRLTTNEQKTTKIKKQGPI